MAESRSRAADRRSRGGEGPSASRHASHVCDRCREKKLKCDEGQPCIQCTLHESECHYSKKRDKRTAISKDEANRMTREIESLQERNNDLTAENAALRAKLAGLSIEPASEKPPSLHIDIPNGSLPVAGPPSSSQRNTPLTVSPYSSGISASPYSSKRSSGQSFTVAFANSRPEPINDVGEAVYATPYSPFAMASGPSTPCSTTSSRRELYAGRSSAVSSHDSPMTTSSSLRVEFGPQRTDTIRPTSTPVIIEEYHDNNCPCLWSAFLPPAIQASLTRELHDLLLLELLSHRTAWCLRVIPRLFLRDMRIFLSGDMDFARLVGLQYSPALHCALLAEALQLAPPGSPLLNRETRDILIQTAEELAKSQVAHNVGLASATQAMATIAQCELAFGQTRAAFLRIRNAIEVARLSGFHHEFLRDGIPNDDGDPLRKLCYLSLLVQDTDVATHTGQDVCPYEHPFPTSYPFLSNQLPPDVRLDSETFVQTAKLMRIIAHMTNKFSKEEHLQASLVTSVENELYDWHRRVPPSHASDTSLSPAILLMHMTYYWATMLLYRPFYGREDAREGWRKYSDEACKRFFTTLRHYERNITFKHAPLTLVNMLVTAGAIALVSAAHARPAQIILRDRALAYAQMAADDLQQIATVWPCAMQYGNTLRGHLTALNAPTIPVPKRRRSQSLSEHRLPRTDPSGVFSGSPATRGRPVDRRAPHTKPVASLSPLRLDTDLPPASTQAPAPQTAFPLDPMTTHVPSAFSTFAPPMSAVGFGAQPMANQTSSTSSSTWAIPASTQPPEYNMPVNSLSLGVGIQQYPPIPEIEVGGSFPHDPHMQGFGPTHGLTDPLFNGMFTAPPEAIPQNVPYTAPAIEFADPLSLHYIQNPPVFASQYQHQQPQQQQPQQQQQPDQNMWDPYLMQ